jgi:serine/threonine protein kinase
VERGSGTLYGSIMTIEIGGRMGPYLVESRIGEGGMGVVYRARDTRLDRLVARKVLTTERAMGEASKRRFYRRQKRRPH